MTDVASEVSRSWQTNYPKLSEVQQFLMMAVKAGATPDAEIEVHAGEGQYGKSDCHMTVHWKTKAPS